MIYSEKLVRDGWDNFKDLPFPMPCSTRILDLEEFPEFLDKKLKEEVLDYFERRKVDSLVDILEVVLAIASYRGVSSNELETQRIDKRKEHGGFERRLCFTRIWEE